MARIFLTIILPLFLPTLLYLGWMAAARRLELAGPAATRRALPWSVLAIAGVVLTVLILAAVTIHLGSGQDGVYVAPHVVDGQVVPGHMAPAKPRP